MAKALVHGFPAGFLNAAPVEVVAHVQNVLRILQRGTGLEGIGHKDLWVVIHTWMG